MSLFRPLLIALLLAGAAAPAVAQEAVPVVSRFQLDRADYRQQLIRELASREALLKQQEAQLGARTQQAKKAQEALIAEAKKPPAEPSDDNPAPTARRGEPSPIALKSKAFERETYFSMIARSEVYATRRDIQLIREILARTS